MATSVITAEVVDGRIAAVRRALVFGIAALVSALVVHQFWDLYQILKLKRGAAKVVNWAPVKPAPVDPPHAIVAGGVCCDGARHAELEAAGLCSPGCKGAVEVSFSPAGNPSGAISAAARNGDAEIRAAFRRAASGAGESVLIPSIGELTVCPVGEDVDNIVVVNWCEV